MIVKLGVVRFYDGGPGPVVEMPNTAARSDHWAGQTVKFLPKITQHPEMDLLIAGQSTVLV